MKTILKLLLAITLFPAGIFASGAEGKVHPESPDLLMLLSRNHPELFTPSNNSLSDSSEDEGPENDNNTTTTSQSFSFTWRTIYVNPDPSEEPDDGYAPSGSEYTSDDDSALSPQDQLINPDLPENINEQILVYYSEISRLLDSLAQTFHQNEDEGSSTGRSFANPQNVTRFAPLLHSLYHLIKRTSNSPYANTEQVLFLRRLATHYYNLLSIQLNALLAYPDTDTLSPISNPEFLRLLRYIIVDALPRVTSLVSQNSSYHSLIKPLRNIRNNLIPSRHWVFTIAVIYRNLDVIMQQPCSLHDKEETIPNECKEIRENIEFYLEIAFNPNSTTRDNQWSTLIQTINEMHETFREHTQ